MLFFFPSSVVHYMTLWVLKFRFTRILRFVALRGVRASQYLHRICSKPSLGVRFTVKKPPILGGSIVAMLRNRQCLWQAFSPVLGGSLVVFGIDFWGGHAPEFVTYQTGTMAVGWCGGGPKL